MNLKDIWIGEKLTIKSKDKVGTFEGRGAKNHAFIKIDGKMHLVSAEDLDLHTPKEVEPELKLEEEVETTPFKEFSTCLLYTSPSPRDATLSRMPSSA